MDIHVMDKETGGEIHFIFTNKTVSGILKLAQMVHIMLLTKFQSKAIDPEDGNNIVSVAKNTNMSDGALFHEINVAFDNIVRVMKEEDSSYYPDDERLDGIKLLKVYKSGRSVISEAEIKSVSKETVTVKLPVRSIR